MTPGTLAAHLATEAAAWAAELYRKTGFSSVTWSLGSSSLQIRDVSHRAEDG